MQDEIVHLITAVYFIAAVILLLVPLHMTGKIVSSVCHGPNGLVNVKSSSGKHIVDGKNVTGFSNTEEEAVGKTNVRS